MVMLALEYSSSVTASGAKKYTLDSGGQTEIEQNEPSILDAHTNIQYIGWHHKRIDWHHHIAFICKLYNYYNHDCKS